MESRSDRRHRYDWALVQRFFDAGNGFVACQKAFGFSHTAWIKAIRRGDLLIPKRVDGLSDLAGYMTGLRFKNFMTMTTRILSAGHISASLQLPGRRQSTAVR